MADQAGPRDDLIARYDARAHREAVVTTKRPTRAHEIAEALTPRPGRVRQPGTRHEDLLVSVARELERALAKRRKLRRELRAADAVIKDRKLALRRLIAETANREQEL